MLPQSSVAVHVLVAVYVPAQDPGVLTSENVIVTLGSQVSVAVGGVINGVAGQLIGVVCVTQIIVGGVMSCTTIVLLHVAVFPQSSVAVHVLVAVYVPGHDPGVVTSVKVMATNGSQVSVAVGGRNNGT